MCSLLDEPTILHADVDAFFASVEQRDAPRLIGKPVIVGGGVVMAASYEARAYGVRGGMGGAEARRLCPRRSSCRRASAPTSRRAAALFEVFRDTAPHVDGRSLEEAFLDVSGLERIAGTPAEIAERPPAPGPRGARPPAQRRHREDEGAGEDGEPRGEAGRPARRPADGEREFLHPLPVERIWGVGPATAARLHGAGIATVGDIAVRSEQSLVADFGDSTGRWLHALAHFRDPTTRRRGRGRRSFGSQSALGRRRRSRRELDNVLCRLVERVTGADAEGGPERAHGRPATALRRLLASDPVGDPAADDRGRPRRSSPRPRPPRRGRPDDRRRGITLLGITITNLDIPGVGVQLELPFDGDGGDALDSALDQLREQFGSATVTRGPPGRESAGLVDVSR